MLEYPELGMEAVWRIEVEDFPAFVVVDDKGNDFFADVTRPMALTDPAPPGVVTLVPHAGPPPERQRLDSSGADAVEGTWASRTSRPAWSDAAPISRR